MFGFSFGELVFVALIVLVFVGPKKLPELMRTAGKAMRQLQRAGKELRAQTGIDEMMRDEDLAELAKLREAKILAQKKLAMPMHSVARELDIDAEFPPKKLPPDSAAASASVGSVQAAPNVETSAPVEGERSDEGDADLEILPKREARSS